MHCIVHYWFSGDFEFPKIERLKIKLARVERYLTAEGVRSPALHLLIVESTGRAGPTRKYQTDADSDPRQEQN